MKITSFMVLPDTPLKLKHLNSLAYNFYFTWHGEVASLFEKLDPPLWQASGRNPVRILCLISQHTLNKAAGDTHFLSELKAVHGRFQNYLNRSTWFEQEYGKERSQSIAFFSPQFALHDAMPGDLSESALVAADYVKAASDAGLPLVGVGLLMGQAAFEQVLDSEGMQQERVHPVDWVDLPIRLEEDESGNPIKSWITIGTQRVGFQIWRASVGSVPIYLLDARIPENPDIFQKIHDTSRGHEEMTRLWQCMLLGMGGVRALQALGHQPEAYHLHGESGAFACLERIRQSMAQGLKYIEAKDLVWSSTVYTLRHDGARSGLRFQTQTMVQAMTQLMDALGLNQEHFLELGQETRGDPDEFFSLPALAMRLSARANGVSRIHAQLNREHLQGLYPQVQASEIPIQHVPDGVHGPSWMSARLMNLIRRHLGPTQADEWIQPDVWSAVQRIPDDELWDLHEFKRRQMVEWVRQRLRRQLASRNASPEETSTVDRALDPKILTVGMVSCFSQACRGTLLLNDLDRLERLVCHEDRPVQFVIAGKANPEDAQGKRRLQSLFHAIQKPPFQGRIVFIENLNLYRLRHLVQGVDLWLDTSRRPHMACHTAGIKAALNGALNMACLDGWWEQACQPELGWAIGRGETFEDHQFQDQLEADLTFGLLENKVASLFYLRDKDDLPREWIHMMRLSIQRLGSAFHSHPMVQEYCRRDYQRIAQLMRELTADDHAKARELSSWLKKIMRAWNQIHIVGVESSNIEFVRKGSEISVRASVHLGDIRPEHVKVECCHGPLEQGKSFTHHNVLPMGLKKSRESVSEFEASFSCDLGGHYGFAVRVLPGHPLLANHRLPGLVKWG